MKWMVPFNQLDAVQSAAVEDIDSSISSGFAAGSRRLGRQPQIHWVKGFAGSGKTIVLTHVAERLAAKQQRRRVGFATYTHALKDLVQSGLSEQAVSRIKITTLDALKNSKEPFDVLIADEVQDVTKRYFSEFQKSYLSLVAAADFDQRIFRQAASETEVRNILSKATHYQLHSIFRISENIFQVATSVHSDAAVSDDATIDERDGQTQLIVARSRNEEWDTVYDEAIRVSAPQFPSAILFPGKAQMEDFFKRAAERHGWSPPPLRKNWTIPADPISGTPKETYGSINKYLKRNASAFQVFGSGSGELSSSATKKTVFLMTYHSAKGLEFDSVFLPCLSDVTSLQAMKGASDLEERRLFFVAATRARRQLYLSYHSRSHRFIGEIPPNLLRAFQQPRRGFGRTS